MKKDIQALLDKEVDRKDFLKHVGLGVLMVSGFGMLTKSLVDFGSKKQTAGFGAGAYGGGKQA